MVCRRETQWMEEKFKLSSLFLFLLVEYRKGDGWEVKKMNMRVTFKLRLRLKRWRQIRDCSKNHLHKDEGESLIILFRGKKMQSMELSLSVVDSERTLQ